MLGHACPLRGAALAAGVALALLGLPHQLALAEAGEADRAAAEERVLRWFPPRFPGGGGIVILPKVYYSSENDLGLGAQVVRPFRFPGTHHAARDSELRLKGRYTTNGHSLAEFRGTFVVGEGRWVVKTRFTYDTLALRFWGVGADTESEAEEVYRPQSTQSYIEISHETFEHLRIGVRAEFHHFKYIETEDGGLLDTVAYPGIGQDNLLGGGLVAEFDSRDNRYEPSSGLYMQAFALVFGEDSGSEFNFNNYHADLRAYLPLGGERVLALQGFFYSALGDAPIWRYAALGGRAHSRGYRKARYLDRQLIAFQGELRFPLFWRVGGVGFAGLANVAEHYDEFRLDTMRPTLGGGLRWRVRPEGNLLLRADFAVGAESFRANLSFGHAF